MSVKTYDPKDISVIIGGNIIQGFADGTFVKFGRMEKMWNLKVGVTGEGTRAKSNNKSGFIEMTIFQSSPSCDALSALIAADELTNSGAVPGLVRDNNGTTLATCLTGWVAQQPDTEFAKEVTARTFRFETDDLEMFVGGE